MLTETKSPGTISARVRKRTATTIVMTDAATLTSDQVLTGILLVDPGGADRNLTLPTATLLLAALAAIGQNYIGASVEVFLSNQADQNDPTETITLVAGSGGSIVGTATVAYQNSKTFRIRVSSATAYVCYSLGTATT